VCEVCVEELVERFRPKTRPDRTAKASWAQGRSKSCSSSGCAAQRATAMAKETAPASPAKSRRPRSPPPPGRSQAGRRGNARHAISRPRRRPGSLPPSPARGHTPLLVGRGGRGVFRAAAQVAPARQPAPCWELKPPSPRAEGTKRPRQECPGSLVGVEPEPPRKWILSVIRWAPSPSGLGASSLVCSSCRVYWRPRV